MKIRQALGIVVVAAAAFVSVPSLLSAQTGDSAQGSTVRITLSVSGEIQVSGDFVLEVEGRDTLIKGKSMVVNQARSITDFRDGMSVESSGFVVEADSGSLVIGDSGQASSVQMRTARITRSQ
jgi:hypothetical protein